MTMLVGCNAEALTITVDDARRVSGLLQVPIGARICFVLADGAGAGIVTAFYGRQISTLRLARSKRLELFLRVTTSIAA